MAKKLIVIPHLPKELVANLPPGWDPSDPPLTHASMLNAYPLVDEIARLHREASAIVCGTRVRCLQTAAPAISRLSKRLGHQRFGDLPVIILDTLSQPDSGDLDKDNPRARADGLVIYGEESYSPDWYNWLVESLETIDDVLDTLGENPDEVDDGPVLIFTHRPFAAAMRWIAQHGFVVPGKNDINALDRSLLPYCVFEKENGQWKELPRE